MQVASVSKFVLMEKRITDFPPLTKLYSDYLETEFDREFFPSR